MGWSEGVDSFHLRAPSRKESKRAAPPCNVTEEQCCQSLKDVYASASSCSMPELFTGVKVKCLVAVLA